jgi:hypothetical protein
MLNLTPEDSEVERKDPEGDDGGAQVSLVRHMVVARSVPSPVVCSCATYV